MLQSDFACTAVIRAVPLMALWLCHDAGLLPTLLVGPVLGVLGVYTYDQGDLLAVQKKLFPRPKGQFKSG